MLAQNMSMYRARLGAMKTYGFDFVRLHSHFESPCRQYLQSTPNKEVCFHIGKKTHRLFQKTMTNCRLMKINRWFHFRNRCQCQALGMLPTTHLDQ